LDPQVLPLLGDSPIRRPKQVLACGAGHELHAFCFQVGNGHAPKFCSERLVVNAAINVPFLHSRWAFDPVSLVCPVLQLRGSQTWIVGFAGEVHTWVEKQKSTDEGL
jgi:hypothetical protein